MSCPIKRMMRDDLVNAKVIDKYNNIMPNEYPLFTKIKSRWVESLRKEYNTVGDPFYSIENGTKIQFNDDLLYKIDASREIFYRENEHYKAVGQGFKSLLAKTLKSFNRLPPDQFYQRGQMVYYKGEVYILDKDDFIAGEYKLYNERGTKTVNYNDREEVQFLQDKATYVKIDGRTAIVLPNNDSIQTNSDGTRKYVSKGDKLNTQRALNAKRELDDFRIGVDDVVLQLYDNSSKTMSYDEFRKEVYNMVNLYKDSYGPLFLQEKIKCL